MDYKKEYTRWCALAKGLDTDVEQELTSMQGDEAKIQDAFYRDLAFGTGGLRGVIGSGTHKRFLVDADRFLNKAQKRGQ